ncbi:hypothetical protein [Sulfuriflexus mobilis]|uniref:hypothetical protein n=1 Tax=Sulfuriflexus mobilis TaxID=1811807 RepID=UPI000F84551B|nr:hypothetical protein [Sulfuriflexus mobilis]
MKNLLTIFVVGLCLFIGTAAAEKPDWAGKDEQAKDTMEVHKDKYDRDYDDKHAKEYKEKYREKYKEKYKEKNDRDDDGSRDKQDKHDEAIERQREKKSASEQKELDNISDSAGENRKKWWKFWE